MEAGTLKRLRFVAPAIAAVVALAALPALTLDGRAGAASEPAAGKSAKAISIKTKSFGMTQSDDRTRFEILCPKNRYPLGGGMSAAPGPLRGGEGVYPNSYERLGRQAGYHITAALIDLGGGATRSQQLTLQVVCVTKKPGKVTPPHKTVYVNAGETKTLTIRCPGKRRLIGGGYQRTTFFSQGGNRILESRAISSKEWRVTAMAEGWGGGELTGIAYCVRSKKPKFTTVTATADIASTQPGSVTTPKCPKSRVLGFVGFGSPLSGDLVYMGSSIDGRTSTASALHDGQTPSEPSAKLTAYGYCLKR
jgi:hypothetical protein